MLFLKLKTVYKDVFSGEIKSFSFISSSGQRQILKNHIDLNSELCPGEVKIITQDDQELVYYMVSGIVSLKKNKIQVLSFPIFDKKNEMQNYIKSNV